MEVFSMRKNYKPGGMHFPMPVLIISTYNEDNSVDCMTAAWGTMEDSDVILLELTKDHKTSENILRNKAFCVSYCDSKNVEAGDYVGIVSYKDDKEKFDKTGWKATKSEFVFAPVIEDLPITMECELERIATENGDFEVYGKIKNISVKEDLIDDNGKIDYSKANLITYNSIDSSYHVIGDLVAKAFNVGLKRK